MSCPLFVSDLKIIYYNNLSILDNNALAKRGKIFCHNNYLETKSFKSVLE